MLVAARTGVVEIHRAGAAMCPLDCVNPNDGLVARAASTEHHVGLPVGNPNDGLVAGRGIAGVEQLRIKIGEAAERRQRRQQFPEKNSLVPQLRCSPMTSEVSVAGLVSAYGRVMRKPATLSRPARSPAARPPRIRTVRDDGFHLRPFGAARRCVGLRGGGATLARSEKRSRKAAGRSIVAPSGPAPGAVHHIRSDTALAGRAGALARPHLQRRGVDRQQNMPRPCRVACIGVSVQHDVSQPHQ